MTYSASASLVQLSKNDRRQTPTPIRSFGTIHHYYEDGQEKVRLVIIFTGRGSAICPAESFGGTPQACVGAATSTGAQ
jgi:hypothetical protein